MKPPFEVGDLVRLSLRGKMAWRDRSKIRKITLDISTDLSPLPFRPEEFTLEDPFRVVNIRYDLIKVSAYK